MSADSEEHSRIQYGRRSMKSTDSTQPESRVGLVDMVSLKKLIMDLGMVELVLIWKKKKGEKRSDEQC